MDGAHDGIAVDWFRRELGWRMDEIDRWPSRHPRCPAWRGRHAACTRD
jgi:hypothetical protein